MYSHIKELANRKELVLGSRSPRRVSLLTELGVPFRQIIPQLDENHVDGEHPYACAKRLAEAKALWVSKQLEPNQLVIGCDTIVVLGDTILGKPADEDEAFEILSLLSGKKHVVWTAIALAERKGLLQSGYETTEVYFNPVTPGQIRAYIATTEPLDKAGAYGIQGMGAFLVDRIAGNLDTVIGLPRSLLDKLAKTVNRGME